MKKVLTISFASFLALSLAGCQTLQGDYTTALNDLAIAKSWSQSVINKVASNCPTAAAATAGLAAALNATGASTAGSVTAQDAAKIASATAVACAAAKAAQSSGTPAPKAPKPAPVAAK